MTAEVWKAERRDLERLEAERVTDGKLATNGSVIATERTVSRLHAVLERYPAGWSIRDLDSPSGTFVNNQRVLGEHCLQRGNEIRVGNTLIVLRFDHAPHRRRHRYSNGGGASAAHAACARRAARLVPAMVLR